MFWDKTTLLKIWLNPGLNLTIFQGTQPWCIPLCFGVFFVVSKDFGEELLNNLSSRRQQGQGWWQGWSLRSGRIMDHAVTTKMLFFCWHSNPLQIFSAPAREGNLFFLSARFKSNHLRQTSRPLWLSSSTFWMPLCLPTNLHFEIYWTPCQGGNWHWHNRCKGVVVGKAAVTITEHFCPWNRHISVNCHPGEVSDH